MWAITVARPSRDYFFSNDAPNPTPERNSNDQVVKRLKYAATLIGALAVLAIAPATAFAEDNDPSGPGGCNYTDADGYNIPIHNGEDVYVDGKIVSCRNGSIVVTTPPARGSDVRGPLAGGDLPVLTEAGSSEPTRPVTPKRPLFDKAPILIATP